MKTLLITALVAASLTVPASAQADYQPVCTNGFFLYGLRMATRTICDGPIRPDGSWMRARGFYAPGYYKTWCGSYSCTIYPIPALDIGPEVYPVTLDTILPDEPGHLG
jgi:hypothetical protein